VKKFMRKRKKTEEEWKKGSKKIRDSFEKNTKAKN